MKRNLLAILFVFFSFCSLAQSNINQQVSLEYQQVSLKEFLLDVQKKYTVQFSFGRINLSESVSIKFDGTLEKGLQKVFSSINLKHKLIGNHITIRNAPLLNLRGNIKATIIDSDTKIPIIGASFVIENYLPFTGTATDENGFLLLKKIAIGRYNFKVNSIGYEEKIVSQILINSAKDIFLEIELIPSISNIKEVVIIAELNKFEASNEMAMSSSRAFSVEETERYAMSISDPARMVQNYAGVTHSGDDSSNDIVIRGNSPRGLLWRLEGVEIPNPNHFGNMGGKGGALSLLSSTTLHNSDFYTSSFPAEYGNSLSGVFDLKLRKGNNHKREHSIKLSLLGLEAATEGYFSKKSKASYLMNFRFSTIDFITAFIPEIKDDKLNFQDISFKIHLPTKDYGSFSFFGLGGLNTNIHRALNDRLLWTNTSDKTDYFERQGMGVVGITHKKAFNNKTQLHSSIATTANYQKWTIDILNQDTAIKPLRILHTNFNNTNIVFSSKLSHKISKKHLLQLGIINSIKLYDNFLLSNRSSEEFSFFSENGYTNLLQNFAQWKFRLNDKLTTNLGYHFTYLFLNNTWAIDPRFGLKYKANQKHHFSFSTGIHSQPEHTTTYLIEKIKNGIKTKENLNLKISKAYHTVASWDYKFAKNFRFKTEIYYQYLFDIPVQADSSSNFSTLNSENIYNIISYNNTKLVNKGTGQNFGIDVTLEKTFSDNYYIMFTGSLFDSYYTTFSGRKFRTDFANNYLINLLGGKEFIVGKNKNNKIGLNAKIMLNGGQRYTPIDVQQSKLIGKEVVYKNAVNIKQFDPYFRADIGFNYVINTKFTRHTFQLDIQNVSNQKNYNDINYNTETEEIDKELQLGFLPFISYKIDFSFKK